MEKKISLGLTAEKEDMVNEHNTAIAYGSGGVMVYATPAMVGLMENAALSCVDPLLDEGMATVGTYVNIKHLAATPIGMKVTAKAKLVAINGRSLEFQVEAYDEKEKIGEGMHGRYMINLAKFLSKVQQKGN